jgi:hypothetical protein
MPRSTSAALLACFLAVFAGCIERSEPTSYFIPSGHVGEVFVIFGVPDGTPPETLDGRRIYRIPPGGILRTQFPPTYGWSKPLYFYGSPSAAELVPIPTGPASTIHDTPENRSNLDVEEILGSVVGGIGAPAPGQPGTFSSNAPCAVKYASFFVGTRAQFLDSEHRLDIADYLKSNPVKCAPAA